MQYWLMKSEPNVYGITHLKHDRVGQWDGVRNYQARNFIRSMEVGDCAIMYHSNMKQATGAVGEMSVEVVAYPDPTQFDKESEYFDVQSTPDNQRWSAVKVRFVREFTTLVTLDTMRAMPALTHCRLLMRGNRLSVLPLTKNEYDAIVTKGMSS